MYFKLGEEIQYGERYGMVVKVNKATYGVKTWDATICGWFRESVKKEDAHAPKFEVLK